MKPVEGYTGELTAKIGNNDAETVLRSDGRYRIKIPDIAAHQLGGEYTLTITTAAGVSTITVSVLDYVKACLNNSSSTDDEKNAAAALYYYSKAADEYLATP